MSVSRIFQQAKLNDLIRNEWKASALTKNEDVSVAGETPALPGPAFYPRSFSPFLSVGQLGKEESALRVLAADELCQEKGWLGPKRQKFIIKEAGLPPGTSDRAIRKLLELGRKLRANQKTEPAKTPAQPVADPNRHVKMARARANYLALSPEAQEEFRKWIG